jgi:hypothetical protein
MPFRLTTLATYRSPAEAWVAKNYLAAHGIRAFVHDENISTAIWTWGNAIGWTKLQVETEFVEAARRALSSRREDRDFLLDQCREATQNSPETSMPPCMDRKPVTAAERPERKANEREDLACRAKLAAVFALIMLGIPVGLPLQWERLSGLPGLFVELVGLGLLGYSTWLLWAVSTSPGTLRPTYEQDMFWGRCINGIVYSLLTVLIMYVVSLSQ